MELEKLSDTHGQILKEGNKGLVITDDESLEDARQRFAQEAKPIEQARRQVVQNTFKRKVMFSPLELKQYFRNHGQEDNAVKAEQLKSDNPVVNHKKIRNELAFFGQSFFEGFMAVYGIKLNNAVDRYESQLRIIEIQEIDSGKQPDYFIGTTRQGKLEKATERLESQERAQKELNTFYESQKQKREKSAVQMLDETEVDNKEKE